MAEVFLQSEANSILFPSVALTWAATGNRLSKQSTDFVRRALKCHNLPKLDRYIRGKKRIEEGG